MELKDIEFIEGNEEQLDSIGLLWDRLNAHHTSVSTYFSEQFAKFSFKKRRRGIIPGKDGKIIKVDLAKLIASGEVIGYCFSSIINAPYGRTGEIESLYVEPEYRGIGIGDRFMCNLLEWMDRESVDKKMLVVAVGNEEVFGFYRKFGFYPKSTRLDYKEDSD